MAGHASQQARLEVTAPLPVIGTTESRGSPTDLPTRLHPQSGRPRPRAVQRVGLNNDPDEAFNLRRRVYPLDRDVSMAEPTTSISPASGKLLAAEEGHIGVLSGVGETRLDPPVGEHPRELHLGQVRPPPPRHPYELGLNRDHDQPIHGPLPDRMYSGDARYGHEGILFHLAGIKAGWYDPPGLGRGPEARYGPYHSQYILPPPFASHQYAGYANDPPIHLQHAMGRGHYANAPPPFHPHAAEYANPNGGREPPAYRHAHVYDPMPSNAGVGAGTQEGANHSAGATVIRPEVVSNPYDLPAGNIANTSGT